MEAGASVRLLGEHGLSLALSPRRQGEAPPWEAEVIGNDLPEIGLVFGGVPGGGSHFLASVI